jgi:hypothetical protein
MRPQKIRDWPCEIRLTRMSKRILARRGIRKEERNLQNDNVVKLCSISEQLEVG